MADVEFELNNAGIVEIAKSPDMQAALLSEASQTAGAATAAARGHEKPPYAAHVDVLDRTAVGAAHSNTEMGRLDEAKFKSLSRQNH